MAILPGESEPSVGRSEEPDSVDTGDAYSTMLHHRPGGRFNPDFFIISTPFLRFPLVIFLCGLRVFSRSPPRSGHLAADGR